MYHATMGPPDTHTAPTLTSQQEIATRFHHSSKPSSIIKTALLLTNIPVTPP